MRKFASTGIVVAAAAALGLVTATAQDGEGEAGKFNYTVEEGNLVDESTMMGYTIYSGSCMACHGPDGLGSSFAPSLVRAAERRTFADFAQTIAGGRSVQPGLVMPSFAEDERVMSHIEDVWNYLGARYEGGLGRGRPRPIEASAPAQEDEGEGAGSGTE